MSITLGLILIFAPRPVTLTFKGTVEHMMLALLEAPCHTHTPEARDLMGTPTRAS